MTPPVNYLQPEHDSGAVRMGGGLGLPPWARESGAWV